MSSDHTIITKIVAIPSSSLGRGNTTSGASVNGAIVVVKNIVDVIVVGINGVVG